MLRLDGALCLTFVNTGLGEREALESFADWLAWSVGTGALNADVASRLEPAAAERPEEAVEVMRRATTLRQTLERILSAVDSGGEPAVGDLEAFNTELGVALAHRRLATAKDGFSWQWAEGGERPLERMLWACGVVRRRVACLERPAPASAVLGAELPAVLHRPRFRPAPQVVRFQLPGSSDVPQALPASCQAEAGEAGEPATG